jgi:hypothetical protein
MRESINKIGARMVACANQCRGVARDQGNGILPRCLILENDGRLGSAGSIVCGLNPARCKKQERAYYITHGANYESVVDFWNMQIRYIQYYVKLRKLVNALGLSGPILWTDTVKCEKQANLSAFSHLKFPDTVRRCAAYYLHQELSVLPHEWIAIGVGRDAFAALSLLCPDRFVLGVPHCTGQYIASGQFDELFTKGLLRPLVIQRYQDARIAEPKGALWLTSDI